jgi:hypothetical protein
MRESKREGDHNVHTSDDGSIRIPRGSPTQAEFAPNPNSEGSMLIYTGNIGVKSASGDLFAYAEVLQVMQLLWEEVSRDQIAVGEAALVE